MLAIAKLNYINFSFNETLSVSFPGLSTIIANNVTSGLTLLSKISSRVLGLLLTSSLCYCL